LSFPDPAFVLPVCTQLCLLVTNKIPINQPIITASSNMGFLPRFPDTHKKKPAAFTQKSCRLRWSAGEFSSRDQFAGPVSAGQPPGAP
jgi:hypothetical protein